MARWTQNEDSEWGWYERDDSGELISVEEWNNRENYIPKPKIYKNPFAVRNANKLLEKIDSGETVADAIGTFIDYADDFPQRAQGLL